MFGVLLLSLICLAPSCIASSSPASAPKVALDLYYESLCPDCQLFISQQLYPTYQKVSEIFNLTLVPYGNAEESKRGAKWVFECQHGPKECQGNLIETCAISLLKNISVSFPFVHCFEKDIGRQDPKAVAENCAKSLGIDYAPIEGCVSGPQGNELEHKMAMKTDALEPQHEYVPWVTINGKHTEKMQRKAQNNLLALVCEYYTGTKPSECAEKIGRCYKN
ncbi:antigen processing and presentation of exogenous peptide antigen via MHC class I [Desmophyllum pertusum]|uniref:Antigen processing and presentation of exogenous peptide antigen via MHC class I n=1 Tax=Desmophyllum pertusum TaxID=174260 RepID=A0A9W9YRV8_9CNID|nr:antigen processing and presentation of exogenous peptide antigen via MHC class I [Desmophyllum pertusum]